MQQRGCAPRCVEMKGQNPKERSSSWGVVVVGAKERSQPSKRALAARFRGWRVGGAARERSQPLKTSVSGLGCWQQPESGVGGRWRLKKGPNPKQARFRVGMGGERSEPSGGCQWEVETSMRRLIFEVGSQKKVGTLKRSVHCSFSGLGGWWEVGTPKTSMNTRFRSWKVVAVASKDGLNPENEYECSFSGLGEVW